MTGRPPLAETGRHASPDLRPARDLYLPAWTGMLPISNHPIRHCAASTRSSTGRTAAKSQSPAASTDTNIAATGEPSSRISWGCQRRLEDVLALECSLRLLQIACINAAAFNHVNNPLSHFQHQGLANPMGQIAWLGLFQFGWCSTHTTRPNVSASAGHCAVFTSGLSLTRNQAPPLLLPVRLTTRPLSVSTTKISSSLSSSRRRSKRIQQPLGNVGTIESSRTLIKAHCE